MKLEEFMGTYEESEDEEGQSRRRPRTMGLRKALAREREQESTLSEKLPLNDLLAMEMEQIGNHGLRGPTYILRPSWRRPTKTWSYKEE